MPRPFTRVQALQNRAFLERLAGHGNARLAARETGVRISTMHHRRGVSAALAQEWDAAVALVNARLVAFGYGSDLQSRAAEAKGRTAPFDAACGIAQDKLRQAQGERSVGESELRPAVLDCPSDSLRSSAPPPRSARSPSPRKLGEDFRTRGGEPVVVRTRAGKLQVRPAHPGKLTRTAEQMFLQALSATCNVRLSAAAAGASPAAFYRRRTRSRAFDREVRLALETGYRRLEAALLESSLAASYEDDAWRHNEPPPIPPMTAEQALQLLHHHEKSVAQAWEKPHRRRRRGETDEVYVARLRAMWTAEKAREAEEEAVRSAYAAEGPGGADGPALPALPALEQVTGWSKASGRPAHDPKVAMFGGWRIADMEKKLRGR